MMWSLVTPSSLIKVSVRDEEVINIAYSLLLRFLSLVVLGYWFCPYCQASVRSMSRRTWTSSEWRERDVQEIDIN